MEERAGRRPTLGPRPPDPSGMIPEVLPVIMDQYAWPVKYLHGHYGLKAQVKRVTGARGALPELTRALDSMGQFYMNPIQLNREGKALGEKSWDKVKRAVLAFMGFAMQHGDAFASLLCYIDPGLLLMYLAFLRARGVGKSTLLFHLEVTEKVVAWLCATGSLATAATVNEGRLAAYTTWRKRLHAQISENLVMVRVPRSVEALMQQGRWLDADLPAVEVERARLAVVKALEEGRVGDLDVAIHNTLFCCMCFGYMPPLRPSILISLVGPDYKGPCLHKDCQNMGTCPGNRLVWKGGERF